MERTCERIACQHVARGCDFMGKAPVVQKHELECKYGDAPCALKCSYVGQRRFHSEHQGNCPVYLKQQEEARKKAEEEARKRREQVEAEEKRDRELQLYDSLNPAAENIVRLCVGGQHFQTSREVLCREPQSVLAGLFSGKRPLQRDNAGVVFLDLDPIAFGHILAWLRTGVVPGEHSPLLLETAKRLKLEGLIAVLGVPIEEPKKNPPLTQAELLHHVTSYALMGAVKKNSNSDPIQLPGANLSGLCLCGLNLSNANLTNANLSNANLSNANLWEANLSNTNLSNTDLTKANLAKADLTKANLTDAKIYNSCLTDANLTDTKISNSKLNNANLTDTKISNSKLNNANLNNAKLTNANLTNANLTNAKIYNSSLSNAKLNNANLSNAKLNGAYLNNTDLTNANLTDADLTNADLSNANINGANLDKARGYRR